MIISSWGRSDSPGILDTNEVYVWHAELNCTDSQLYAFEKIISPDELIASKRFVKESDQKKYIASKAITRDILSRYLQVLPNDIEFVLSEHGKPFVKNNALHFNVSHSGDCFLMGVTLDHPIGVDLEYVRENNDYLALAKRFFAASECQAIKNKDDFYRCWTRKEAFIKAMGLGLTFGLSNFEVSVSPLSLEKSALISVYGDADIAKKWIVKSISFDNTENYFAAVCVQKK